MINLTVQAVAKGHSVTMMNTPKIICVPQYKKASSSKATPSEIKTLYSFNKKS